MYELKPVVIQCPFCLEQFDSSVDLSCVENTGDIVQYTEDCYVCCRPILFTVGIDEKSELTLLIQQE